jgi:hypothetical protein
MTGKHRRIRVRAVEKREQDIHLYVQALIALARQQLAGAEQPQQQPDQDKGESGQ